jgi:pimeloyl-ACP methyl ester carboxylesterase
MSQSQATDTSTAAPTVVLVHGAFADAGSWAPVTERLLAAGVKVQAVVNPLRGLATDAAYVASAISQIAGRVVAVGHSYPTSRPAARRSVSLPGASARCC